MFWILGFLALLAIIAYFETYLIEIKRINITGRNLKRDFSFLLISDLHFHKRFSKIKFSIIKKKLNSLINNERFDFIFYLGDFIDNDNGLPYLDLLLKNIDVKSYGVLGNHDYNNYNILHFLYPLFKRFDKKSQNVSGLMDILEKNGVKILKDVFVEESDIFIYGVDYYSKDNEVKFDFSKEGFKILLSHYPEVVKFYTDKCDLILSGHTHGGQITFFGMPIIMRSRLKRKWARGISNHNLTTLIVTKGIGESFYIPFRLFSRPEILIVNVKGG